MCLSDSPQASILCCSSSRDDLGDEDAGVITDVWVICPSSYAKAQPRVTLWPWKVVSDNRDLLSMQISKVLTHQLHEAAFSI